MSVKTIAREIDLASYDTYEIESELIKIYLKQANIEHKSVKNIFLQSCTSKQSNEGLQRELLSYSDRWTLHDMENLFYTLLGNDARQQNGIVFTPHYIVDYILQKTADGYDNPTICDFSCGCGVFLLRAVERKKERDPHLDVIAFIEQNIYGVDIVEANVRRTKILLSLLALTCGQDQEHIRFNIHHYDSTKNDVLHVLDDEKVLQGFDCVVGNPPYIKIQDLGVETREQLLTSFQTSTKGSFNIYYAFIELGMKYLKETGKMGYIVPNYFLKMHSAEPLRQFLIENTYLSTVIDFKDNMLFDNAQTYSAIIVLDKERKTAFQYAVVQELTTKELQTLDATLSDLPYEDINSKTINLLNEVEKRNIRKIENVGSKLKISTGIATQKDSLYILGLNKNDKIDDSEEFYYKEYEGKLYPIEKKITKSLIKGGANIDFTRGAQVKKANIIYPYYKLADKVKVIPEDQLSTEYPHAYQYLQVIQEELGKRNNGKPDVNVWYEYGRSQALDCFGPKIILPTNSKLPKFVLFEEEALFNNGYAIYESPQRSFFENPGQNLQVVLKVINSTVMDYYIRRTSYMISGGYYCYQKKYIQNFSIPLFTEEEITFINGCNDRKVLDAFLINKYGLTL